MTEKIFEGNLSDLGAGVAKMQTGETPTIELVTVRDAKDENSALQPCRPNICPPNNYPCGPR